MTEKTISQLSRMLHKVAAKYPATEEPVIMTDIHIRINQETGDVMAYDDNDVELTRIVVDEWIDDKSGDSEFYATAAKELRKLLFAPTDEGKEFGLSMGLIMPYSFVLEDEMGENAEELYLADTEQDTIIVGEPFMQGLSEDLDSFINDLMSR